MIFFSEYHMLLTFFVLSCWARRSIDVSCEQMGKARGVKDFLENAPKLGECKSDIGSPVGGN